VDVGLYGKLPSHGDFLRRRTSDAFVTAWDAWLQDCMAASRASLGDRWLDVYLTSPAWRFAAAAGACGPAPLIGLVVPSVDRVGRYFPLTIVAELPGHVLPVPAASAAGPFFARAERLVIDTLAADYVDFESFDRQLVALGDDLAAFSIPPRVTLEEGASTILGAPGATGCHLPIGSPEQLAPVFEQLLSQSLAGSYNPLALWWTEGSSMVEPSCLITSGLPDPDSFGALLEGSWGQHRWRSVRARVESGPEQGPALVEPPAPLRFRSAAGSDVGKVRAINQDSFIEHPDSGVWVVADGLGGHSDGETASRMVCDAFADFLQTASFEDTVAAACERLDAVNDQLVRAAARSLIGDRSLSTVVALLVRGDRCAILWAGDSRAYRLRSGRLEQLTRDHNLASSAASGAHHDPHAITRAVGAHPVLDLDVCREQVRPGDRFLLCSDGLTRAVPEAGIRAHLEERDVRSAVERLIAATLEAGAPDNVTALVVEAYADTSVLV
jgi:type VI secretion system protein ImpM